MSTCTVRPAFSEASAGAAMEAAELPAGAVLPDPVLPDPVLPAPVLAGALLAGALPAGAAPAGPVVTGVGTGLPSLVAPATRQAPVMAGAVGIRPAGAAA